MARLRQGGWEWNHVWDNFFAVSTGTAPTTQTGTVRTGTYALSCAGTSVNASWIHSIGNGSNQIPNVSGTTYYTRVYINVTALPTNSTRFMSLRAAAGTDTGPSIRLTSTGKLQLGTVAAGTFTQVGSDSAATLTTGVWYRVELGWRFGAGAVDYCEGMVDGVSIASTTTASVSDAALVGISFGWETAPGNTTTLFMDDWAYQDDTGAVNNSWCGAGAVRLSVPVLDNARGGAGWLDGGGATTNLWTCADNKPPTGAATPATGTQIKHGAAETTSTYDANMQDYTTIGVPAGSTVNAIVMSTNAALSNGTNGGQSAFQVVSNPVIAEVTGISGPGPVNIGAYPANWKLWNFGPADQPTVTLGTQPVMRVRRSNAGSPTTTISHCSMGLYIDSTPGVAAGVPDVAMARVRT